MIDLRFAAKGLAPDQVNVTYGLYPSWRGRGGKEAVIRVEPENAASAAVAQRAGFIPGKHTYGEDGTRLDWFVRDLCVEAQ